MPEKDYRIAGIFGKVKFSFVLKIKIFVSLIFVLSIITETRSYIIKLLCVKFSFQSIAEQKKTTF